MSAQPRIPIDQGIVAGFLRKWSVEERARSQVFAGRKVDRDAPRHRRRGFRDRVERDGEVQRVEASG
jgi:hypothetical protein